MKQRLLTLLIALSATFTGAWADKDKTVEIGIEQGGTDLTTILPIYTYRTYHMSQQIYTSEEIGIPQGGKLKSISLYYDHSNQSYALERSTNLTIKLANTTVESLEGDYPKTYQSKKWVTGGTTYTFNNFTLPATSGWITITFNNPFVYNGNNLAILVYSEMTKDYQYGRFRSYNCGKNQSLYVNYDIEWQDNNYSATSHTFNPNTPTKYAGRPVSSKNQIKMVITPYPGLSYSEVIAPEKVVAGKPFTMSANVKNIDEEDASPEATIYVEASADGSTWQTAAQQTLPAIESGVTTSVTIDNAVAQLADPAAENIQLRLRIDALGKSYYSTVANVPYIDPANCVHVSGTPVQENVVEPKCTEKGSYDLVVYCTLCGSELSRETVYWDALGHDYLEDQVYGPTCEENGFTNFKCSRCGDSYTDNYIPALGHAWGTPTYVWADDYSQVSAKHTCERDASHVDSENVLTTSEVTKEPTSTEPGEITYTATFTQYGFTTQTKVVPGVAINEANFPDEKFRAILLNYGIGTNGVLTVEEAAQVKELDVREKGITDLTGIEYFPELQRLLCPSNNISSLDVSKNTKLVYLWCGENPLTELNITGCTELTKLHTPDTQLTAIDLSTNTKMVEISANNNPLNAIDVTNCPDLDWLQFPGANITTLDVSKNSKLKTLDYSKNKLTSLDVSHNPLLETLSVWDGQLTGLDLSQNPNLKTLYCSENSLSELNLSYNTKLELVTCQNNNLTTLNVSGCSKLKDLRCFLNKLTTLDVSDCTALEVLNFRNNQLTAIDLSNNQALTELYLSSNKIGVTQMQTIVNALPTVEEGKFIGIDTQDADEQNVISKAQVTSAKSKGWNVQDRNGGTPVDYEGATAIQHVDGTQGSMRSCYTIDGRKLPDVPATNGMYIVNGEKVIK